MKIETALTMPAIAQVSSRAPREAHGWGNRLFFRTTIQTGL
jgi:hypothetical protein